MQQRYLIPPALQKTANSSPFESVLRDALKFPAQEPMWKTLAKGMGIAGGLAVGGKIVDSAIGATSHYLGRALARKRMKGHLDAMPLHVRQEVIGTHPEETIDARFDELYEISPTMMSRPQSAVGMVSETLRQNQHAVSPMAMKEMVDLENSVNRGKVPGIGEELGRSTGDAIIRHTVEKSLTDPMARIREHAAVQAIKDYSSRQDAEKEHERKLQLMRDKANLESGYRAKEKVESALLDHQYRMDEQAAIAQGRMSEQLYMRGLESEHRDKQRAYDDASEEVLKALTDASVNLLDRRGYAESMLNYHTATRDEASDILSNKSISKPPRSHTTPPDYTSIFTAKKHP